ncbi:MAG TPA: hypothetical protein VEC38_05050 [Candidatus Binataceae bacterium]|nr:hypothetical protein [Candidatus Binataceae bacterium]
MFRSLLRMQLLSPVKLGRMAVYLPQFVRVFFALMTDARVGILAKLVPLLAVLLMLTPPALELDFIPVIGELDWLLVGFLALKLFVWLCPPHVVREHVSRIARGA